MIFVADMDGTMHARSRALDACLGHRLGEEASLAALVDSDDAAGQAGVATALRRLEEQREVSTQLCVPGADGAASTFSCTLRREDDGSIHGHLQLVAAGDTPTQRIEHVLLQAVMNTLDIVLWAINPKGTFVYHDGKALAAAGLERGQLLGLDIFALYPEPFATVMREVLAGKPLRDAAELHGRHWNTWYVPLTNDAGEVDYCAGITLDVTERVETEQRLEQQLATIKNQQRAILELSAPILNVWDGVLAVPLIGIMDAQRTDELSDRLLSEVHRAKVRFAILDLTGVEAVDTSIAGHVL
ncbi:MAG: PAS domain-containing protein, partial [Myxococcales bacterium]|nr:PAS domain-containing protein [Myxococcales bacterium]